MYHISGHIMWGYPLRPYYIGLIYGIGTSVLNRFLKWTLIYIDLLGHSNHNLNCWAIKGDAFPYLFTLKTIVTIVIKAPLRHHL